MYISKTPHTHYSEHVSDIRYKDGEHQHHAQDEESGDDVAQPGERTSSTEQQDESFTGLEHTHSEAAHSKQINHLKTANISLLLCFIIASVITCLYTWG